MQETQVRSLRGQEDAREKEMATHSTILAWRIPWTEEPGRLQCMDSQKTWIRLSNYTTSLASPAPTHQGLWYIKHFPWVLHRGGLSQLCQWLRMREIILQGESPRTKLFSVLAESPTVLLNSETTCLGRASSPRVKGSGPQNCPLQP